MDNDQIERELQRPIPREVKCRDGKWGAIRPFMVLLLPHTWIAVLAPFVLLILYVQAFFPDKVTATVIEQTRHLSKTRLSYSIKFKYKVDGKEYSGTQAVSEDIWNSLPEGQTVTVNTNRLAPAFEPSIEGTRSDLFVIPFATLWATMWCGIMYAIVWNAIEPPLRSRSLCINGKAVKGELVKIEVRTGRSTSHIAHYTYAAIDRSTGRTSPVSFKRKFRCKSKFVGLLQEGQPVTVLYDPAKPGKSIVYQLGEYAALARF